MKLLVRIALAIAILACAGALFFANKLGSIRDTLKHDKEQLTVEKNNLTKDLASTKDQLTSTTQKLAQKSEDYNNLSATYENAKIALTKAQTDAANLQAKLDTTSKELEQTKTDYAAAKETLTKLEPIIGSEEFKNIDKIKERLSAQNDETKILGQQMVVMRAENDMLKKQVASLSVTPVNLRGHVAAVQSSWGFVVLDLGKDQHVQTNTDFLVYRDTKLVSKVAVRTVGQNTSVAEVLPEFQRGVQPKVGDLVVH